MKEKILQMVRESAAREQPYGWLNYQPITLPGYEETVPLRGRDCFDRAGAIFAHLAARFGEGPLSVCDWGSNLGFFVFEAARLGHFARGVDVDPRLVEVCRYLASTGGFRIAPDFRAGTLSPASVLAAERADVLFCFSVLHHLAEQEMFRTLNAMASHCRGAYLELDGLNQGRNALELFFLRVEPVVETNDRYGAGHRKRRTWFCSNEHRGRVFRNLKQRDFVHDRAVFLATGGARPPTVLKRERRGRSSHLHTWLKTGLPHERDLYRKHPSPFFPRLLADGRMSSTGSSWNTSSPRDRWRLLPSMSSSHSSSRAGSSSSISSSTPSSPTKAGCA